MDLLTILIIVVLIVVLGIFGFRILYSFGKLLLYFLAHGILGLVILLLFNLLPFFKIPINLLTVLVAGFGGIIGMIILIVAKALGFY